MKIYLSNPELPAQDLVPILKKWFSQTRFDVGEISVSRLLPHPRFKGGAVGIYNVRLRIPALYYGNGPMSSDTPFSRRGWGRGEKKPHRVRYLAGLDWVEFNDLLNDILDLHKIKAYVVSHTCVMRKGTRRRVSYQTSSFQRYGRMVEMWNKDESDPDAFIDFCNSPVTPFSSNSASSPGGQYRMVLV